MLYILNQRRQKSHGLQLVCGVEISANMTILAVGGVCSIIYACAQLQKTSHMEHLALLCPRCGIDCVLLILLWFLTFNLPLFNGPLVC